MNQPITTQPFTIISLQNCQQISKENFSTERFCMIVYTTLNASTKKNYYWLAAVCVQLVWFTNKSIIDFFLLYFLCLDFLKLLWSANICRLLCFLDNKSEKRKQAIHFYPLLHDPRIVAFFFIKMNVGLSQNFIMFYNFDRLLNI